MNVPLGSSMPTPAAQGLSMGWTIWRAPAAATIEPRGFERIQGKTGKTETTITFTQPGTYVLRATASDGRARVDKDVTITVTEPMSSAIR